MQHDEPQGPDKVNWLPAPQVGCAMTLKAVWSCARGSGTMRTVRLLEKRGADCPCHTDVHLIELDLLRGGERPGWEVKELPLVCEYIVLVNRAFGGDIRRSEIWPVALDEPLPLCPVPLLPPDADVPLSLGEVLAQVYQRAAYTRRIDYALPVPPPPLRPAMQRWLAAHLVSLRSK
jgi:uncharacterized protein DUF4058